MCGIAGMIAAPGAAPLVAAPVERAITALAHRGPDASGVWASPRAVLGNTRLSIIDVEQGDQPMWNEERTVVVVYNGEIWNHAELRRELEQAGHRFATRADTEVLVHGWEEWGEELPAHLDGMYAFAVWDTRQERLLLARDRVGKKPLYLAETPAGLAFGSDARSVLLAAELPARLERSAVPEYLFQRYVVAPRTLFEGVAKLRPGHRALYDVDGLSISSYWRPGADGTPELSPGELRDLLRDAVRRRLMSDVPIGALLSGGVDSTAVVALMREATDQPLATFTVGFEDPLYDERRIARGTSRRFSTEHYEVLVRPEEFVDTLPRLSWYRDEPIAEASEIPLLLLAELAGSHVKVVLSGDGGDELFGGYPKYRADRLIRALPPARAALRLAAAAASARRSHRQLARAVETMAIRDPIVRWSSWFRAFSPAELSALLTPEIASNIRPEGLAAPLAGLLEPYEGLDAGRRMLVGDLLTYLPDNMLLRSDKVLMGASVEGRAPLLDRRIVEAASALPVSKRASFRSPKRILRQAVDDLLPAEVKRARKRGFPVPVAGMLAGPGSDLPKRLLLSDRSLERGLFRADAVRRLVAETRNGTADRERKLFVLISLELWHRVNVDRIMISPPGSLAELVEQ